MTLRVGIVGCGLIGSRRALTALSCGDAVTAVTDIAADRAGALAARTGARVARSCEELVGSADVDAVVVATVNTALAEVTGAALAAEKHVLCEKPFGVNAEEAALLVEAAQDAGCVVKVGFTLRHHEAVQRAHEIARAGGVGAPLGIRAAYGHGGRPGYEKEWRGDPALAGGGELLDQGVHLLDLSRWFLGEFAEVTGYASTWCWPVEPLEDNAFMLLRTEDGRTASLHTSWTQWRNLFRFEVIGTEGLLSIEGLGGSYGPERLVHARPRPQGGVPELRDWTTADPGQAWTAEWLDFTGAIARGRPPLTTSQDGYQAARLVDAVYASSRDGGPVRLSEAVLR